jgi:hypothetical protein
MRRVTADAYAQAIMLTKREPHTSNDSHYKAVRCSQNTAPTAVKKIQVIAFYLAPLATHGFVDIRFCGVLTSPT